jgi:hypothetical protein
MDLVDEAWVYKKDSSNLFNVQRELTVLYAGKDGSSPSTERSTSNGKDSQEREHNRENT